MIGRLSGEVDYVAEDHVLLDVGGVGYVVHCATTTLARLGPGQRAVLYTDLVVREDLMQLFGFATPVEREWHRLLTSVQGVGARVSLAILGTLGTEGIGRALALQDAGAVKQAPGVGPKLAQRVVNELKGKAPDMLVRAARPNGAAIPPTDAPLEPAQPSDVAAADLPDGDANALFDALSALVNLGYDRGAAHAALVGVAADRPADTATLIKAALRSLDEAARLGQGRA
ncbi:MAG: Holliday junction branch migration protein RuvA [Pseudomonadota bacterium]